MNSLLATTTNLRKELLEAQDEKTEAQVEHDAIKEESRKIQQRLAENEVLHLYIFHLHHSLTIDHTPGPRG